ncbi:MAG: single-stranded-DNA-specific exonuclease RecJ [Alphaproteobacteria bacterium]
MSDAATLSPPDADQTFVDRSVTGRRWLLAAGDERIGLALSQRHRLPEIVGRMMAARGIGLEDASAFLEPRLKDCLPDPSHLLDMNIAAARLADAVEKGEQIGLFGDYDVDGATSTALMLRALQSLGCNPLWHIPDRMTEGYGPNAPALLELQAQGASLVVTLDCGVTAFEPLEEATKAGLDIIVLDHHTAEPELPAAIAVVNPNRIDESSPHGTLAACGVTFLAIIALVRELRDRGWFEKSGRSEPNLMALLDLVALGTICDVVPLHGLNRALAAQGLKVMAGRTNQGIAALADIGGVNERLNAFHAGFIIGPRINAGGRVGTSGLGAELLTCTDRHRISELAGMLDHMNHERRQLEVEILEQAESRFLDPDAAVLITVAEGWHPGVIGIVASRLKEKYHRPVAVVALDEGLGKASCRSVRGFDFGSAVIAARQSGLLVAGGGHAMAAGFTVESGKLDALAAFLNDRLADTTTPDQLIPTLKLDAVLRPQGASVQTIQALQKMAPFGAGNPSPRLALQGGRIIKPKVLKDKHVGGLLQDSSGGRPVKLIAFNAMETELGPAMLNAMDREIMLAGSLDIDRWNGEERPQLKVQDAALG